MACVCIELDGMQLDLSLKRIALAPLVTGLFWNEFNWTNWIGCNWISI